MVALSLVPAAWAISPELRITQLHRTSWTARDGAPEGARMMVQSSDGFLWLATRTGLFRFDGVRFERYESRSGAPIPAVQVTALLALPQNGLAVGWTDGATLLRNGHADFYEEEKTFPPGFVRGFGVDGSGALWAAVTSGLVRFDGKRWETIGAAWNFPKGQPRALFVGRDGTLGAFTESTLLTLTKGARSFVSTGGKGTSLSPIVQSPSGTYFYADDAGIRPIGGLSEYDRAASSWVLPGHKRSDIQPMLVDRDGGLWFAGVQGLVRVARPDRRSVEPEYFGKREGLSGWVSSVLEDRDGSIWVSTSSGVTRLRAGRVVALMGSEDNDYPALMPEANGAMRFAGVSGDLRELGTDGVLRNIASIAVNCAYRDADGKAWYCSSPVEGKGPRLFTEAGGQFQEIPLPSGIDPGRSVVTVAIDKDRAPWISLESQGVYRREKDGWRLVSELRRGGKLHSMVLTTDPGGDVWIGYSWDRVARWKDGVVRNWESKDGLNLGHVLSMLATDRHVWVGGERGLALLDGEKFRPMSVSDPDVLRGLTGIVETKDGDLWLHGLAGAVLIEAGEVQRAIEQPGRPMVYRLFGSEDGLIGQTPVGLCRPSLVAGVDGRLWFGTVSGVYMLDLKRLAINRVPPGVVIDAALAGNSLRRLPLDGDSRHRELTDLALPALTTNVRVDYTAPTLLAPGRVRFRYRLDGVDRDWREAGTRRQAFYTNLGPGAYRFQVIAANEDGVWDEQGASFLFTIAPAWYQSRWFYMLCAALSVAALVLVYRARVNRVRRQTHARLQARLLERERIARELHDTLIQGFQGLILSFEVAMRRIPRGQPPREQIEEALARADEVLAEGRDRVRGLRESVVYQGDLRSALAEFAQDLASLHPAAFAVDVLGAERQIHPLVLEEVYGIAREALANAFRHAEAQRIDVSVTFEDACLRISIADDGRGIDAEIMAKGSVPGHWGLPGMRERAQKLGAKLRMRSGPKAGTQVELEIPAAVAYRGAHDRDSWWSRLRRHLLQEEVDAE